MSVAMCAKPTSTPRTKSKIARPKSRLGNDKKLASINWLPFHAYDEMLSGGDRDT